MPCYDYICPKCHNRFEVICNKSIRDNIKCEKCQTLADRAILKSPATKIIGYCYNNDNRKEQFE